MRTIATILLLSLAGLNYLQAQDKELIKKSHKLSYEDFSTQYKHNDTAMAIIDVFFNKRESAGTYMSFLPLSVAVTPVVPLAGGLAVIVSSPLFVKGAFMHLRYNKRRLHKILIQFENHEPLAANIQRKYKRMLLIYQIIESETLAMEEGDVE
jgi:uncharacterized protein YdaL